MQINFNKTIKHTDTHNPIIRQNGFGGVIIKNQPNKSIYDLGATSKHWWLQGDPLTFLMGITAYIHLGRKTGFGINEVGANTGAVPKIIDRASPLMWI